MFYQKCSHLHIQQTQGNIKIHSELCFSHLANVCPIFIPEGISDSLDAKCCSTFRSLVANIIYLSFSAGQVQYSGFTRTSLFKMFVCVCVRETS